MSLAVLAVLGATLVVAVLFGRSTISKIDRLTVSWRVAWLKTVVVVVGIITLVVLVPGWVMELEAVADLDHVARDLVGTGVFGAGLVTSLWMLSWAQRKSRI